MQDVPEFVCLVLTVEIFYSVSFKQLSRPNSDGPGLVIKSGLFRVWDDWVD